MMKAKLLVAFGLVMAIIDIAMIIFSINLAYRLRFQSGLISYTIFHSWSNYIGLGVLEATIYPLVFALRGMYRFKRSLSVIDELQKVFISVSVGFVLTLAASPFVLRDFEYSRALLVFAWLLAILLIWVARLGQHGLYRLLLRRGAIEDRALIVGTGEMAKVIWQKIQGAPALGYRPLGFVSANTTAGESSQVTPILGTSEELSTIVRRHGVSEVIIAEPSLSHRHIMDIVDMCQGEQVNIKVFPDIFQIVSSEVTTTDLDGLPMVSVRDVALRGWNLALKRGVDILLSGAILIILSPLMWLIALLIKVTSPGAPVLYFQERVGLDSKPFPVIKFRSMIPGAETETGPVWAHKGDPRITRLGAFLRRFSLDEVPQFINVFFGEMSLVGPRPERPHFVEQFSQQVPHYLERHRVKAGLTGWAQVNGLRGNVSIEERTAYDLWYVENWDLGLDFKIMLRTLMAIFRGENAY
ncbi:MAG: undecaprenyl-phosphate glucose phosphotransferase [Chloroflexi bacterium]|nr:undecaprenyl-phosphate glucose phosphotransferase [Chloroflexota bacterium]